MKPLIFFNFALLAVTSTALDSQDSEISYGTKAKRSTTSAAYRFPATSYNPAVQSYMAPSSCSQRVGAYSPVAASYIKPSGYGAAYSKPGYSAPAATAYKAHAPASSYIQPIYSALADKYDYIVPSYIQSSYSAPANNYAQTSYSAPTAKSYNTPPVPSYIQSSYSAPANNYAQTSYSDPTAKSYSIPPVSSYTRTSYSTPANNYPQTSYSTPAPKTYNPSACSYVKPSYYSPANNYATTEYPAPDAKSNYSSNLQSVVAAVVVPATSIVQPGLSYSASFVPAVPANTYADNNVPSKLPVSTYSAQYISRHKTPAPNYRSNVAYAPDASVYPQSGAQPNTNISTIYENFSTSQETNIVYNGTVFQGPYNYNPSYHYYGAIGNAVPGQGYDGYGNRGYHHVMHGDYGHGKTHYRSQQGSQAVQEQGSQGGEYRVLNSYGQDNQGQRNQYRLGLGSKGDSTHGSRKHDSLPQASQGGQKQYSQEKYSQEQYSQAHPAKLVKDWTARYRAPMEAGPKLSRKGVLKAARNLADKYYKLYH